MNKFINKTRDKIETKIIAKNFDFDKYNLVISGKIRNSSQISKKNERGKYYIFSMYKTWK